MRFVKIPAEWCPTFMFECSDVESLVMEQTRRWFPLFRAVGELCNSYFATVCVVSRCKFLFFIELIIQLNGMVFRSFWKLHFITHKLTCMSGCIPGKNEWSAYSISRYTLWPFVVSVHGKNLMRSRIVPGHVLINLFLAVGYIEWRIPWLFKLRKSFFFFFSGFLFVTTKVAYITAMIFLQIILHSAVYIYDFHIFIMPSSSFHGFKTAQIYSAATRHCLQDIVYNNLEK